MDKKIRVTPAVYSISQFCTAHGNICRASYYNMKKAGKGPREMRVGSRVLISEEAAAEWRRAREAEAAQPTAEAPRGLERHAEIPHILTRVRVNDTDIE